MKVVIASDSFKGSLTSLEVADAVSEGVRRIFPTAEIIIFNVADGGEGTTAAILDSIEGEKVTAIVSDPMGRRIEVAYGIIEGGRTAVMEVAAASGLPLLAPDERNPMTTSSFGTGEMIADALKRGCRKFLIGLGGSATNDGGTGMLSALGYRFYDENGNILEGCGENLEKIVRIDSSSAFPELDQCEFTVACDVDNPFYGPTGAAYIFAPQKGADPAMVEKLDRGMTHFAGMIRETLGKDISRIPGSGAAGGLGGGFMAFLNSRLVSGIGMVLDAVGFESAIEGADMIITGEGRIDGQTAMGKVPYGVLQSAENQGIATLALGGSVEKCNAVEAMGFAAVIQTTPAGMTLEEAMQPEIAKSNIVKAITDYLTMYHKKRP